MKRIKITSLVLAFVITISMLMTGCADATTTANGLTSESIYHVHFGLNDADANTQLVSIDEASEYIRSVFSDNGIGYTEFRTYGAYTENGKTIGNDTLVYMLIFVDEAKIEKMANEIIEHLNLASVLLEGTDAYKFYVGADKEAGRE